MKKVIFLFTVICFLFIYLLPVSSVFAIVDPGNGSGGDGDGDSTTGGDGVTIPVEGDDWLKDIFGEGGLKLNILKPTKFFDIEGTASLWSIVAMVFAIIWPILFVAFLFSIGIGVIKWISSEGEQGKVESAQKTIKNAAIGFLATALIFVVINIVTWWLGIGDIFKLAKNLAVCDGVVLYEYKRDSIGDIDTDLDCECPERATSWQCH